MARTPLLQSLAHLVSEHHEAAERHVPVDVVREERPRAAAAGTPVLSRRAFLTGAGAVAAAAAVPAVLGRVARAATAPRIAIVGGGIAGLTAALTLADAGYASTVYEALPNRAGGRMLSDKPGQPACGSCHSVAGSVTDPTWADGQITDVFGEMIDSSHTTMQGLCKRFNLPLVNLLAAEPRGASETYHFFGQYYPKPDADADFSAVQTVLRKDVQAAGYPTTFDRSTAAGRALDAMSIYEWIETRVPGGHRAPFGQLLDVAYAIEYGADTTDQSALNLIYLLGYNKGGRFNAFGRSDEKYRIDGGIDRLPAALAGYLGLGSTVKLGWVLQALAMNASGSYTLSFDHNRTVTADLVLLALPFAAFGNFDYSRAGFDALKLRAIRELGAGHNGKIQLQFRSRYWNRPGAWGLSSGSTYADTGYQATWEPTRGQAGASGILLKYTGGSGADAMSLDHPYSNARDNRTLDEARLFLTQLEPVFPGISAEWNGRAAGAQPHLNPYWNCSYSYWRQGQCQLFGGYERVRQGNVFFAGEHTSIDFQGFMEGGASEGLAAGSAIVSQLKGRRAALDLAARTALA